MSSGLIQRFFEPIMQLSELLFSYLITWNIGLDLFLIRKLRKLPAFVGEILQVLRKVSVIRHPIATNGWYTEAYSNPCLVSKMEHFVKIVKGF